MASSSVPVIQKDQPHHLGAPTATRPLNPTDAISPGNHDNQQQRWPNLPGLQQAQTLTQTLQRQAIRNTVAEMGTASYARGAGQSDEANLSQPNASLKRIASDNDLDLFLDNSITSFQARLSTCTTPFARKRWALLFNAARTRDLDFLLVHSFLMHVMVQKPSNVLQQQTWRKGLEIFAHVLGQDQVMISPNDPIDVSRNVELMAHFPATHDQMNSSPAFAGGHQTINNVLFMLESRFEHYFTQAVQTCMSPSRALPSCFDMVNRLGIRSVVLQQQIRSLVVYHCLGRYVNCPCAMAIDHLFLREQTQYWSVAREKGVHETGQISAAIHTATNVRSTEEHKIITLHWQQHVAPYDTRHIDGRPIERYQVNVHSTHPRPINGQPLIRQQYIDLAGDQGVELLNRTTSTTRPAPLPEHPVVSSARSAVPPRGSAHQTSQASHPALIQQTMHSESPEVLRGNLSLSSQSSPGPFIVADRMTPQMTEPGAMMRANHQFAGQAPGLQSATALMPRPIALQAAQQRFGQQTSSEGPGQAFAHISNLITMPRRTETEASTRADRNANGQSFGSQDRRSNPAMVQDGKSIIRASRPTTRLFSTGLPNCAIACSTDDLIEECLKHPIFDRPLWVGRRGPITRPDWTTQLDQAHLISPVLKPLRDEKLIAYIDKLLMERPYILRHNHAERTDFLRISSELLDSLPKRCDTPFEATRAIQDGSHTLRIRCMRLPKRLLESEEISEAQWLVLTNVEWPAHLMSMRIESELPTDAVSRSGHGASRVEGLEWRKAVDWEKNHAIDITDKISGQDNWLTVLAEPLKADDPWDPAPEDPRRRYDYAICAESVVYRNESAIRLAVSQTSEEETASRIREILSSRAEDDDDDIQVTSTSITVSVRDPTSSELRSMAVRAKQCRHLECFDLDIFLAGRNVKKPERFLCPLCGVDARPQQLRQDLWMERILSELRQKGLAGSTMAIQVDQRGNWEACEAKRIKIRQNNSRADEATVTDSTWQSRAAFEVIELD